MAFEVPCPTRVWQECHHQDAGSGVELCKTMQREGSYNRDLLTMMVVVSFDLKQLSYEDCLSRFELEDAEGDSVNLVHFQGCQ